MKVKKIAGKDNVLELEFTDASPAYVNTIRRALMHEVPTLAIEIAEIRRNNGILYDEMIAHRLGLVPLVTPVGDYALPSDEEMEEQEFSAKSSAKGTLVAKGPCTVYAGDIKFLDTKVKPVEPKTVITRLLEGQEIELEVTAVLGKGKVHTKWSPGLAYFHEIGTKGGKSLPVADERGQIQQGVDTSDEAIEGKTGHYYFRIEGWGQLSPENMFKIALDELNKSLKEFDSLVKAA